MWSCEKFSCYVVGCYFDIETVHKQLVPLLSTKSLDNRVLRFLLGLAVPGKLLCTVSTLSRAPLTKVDLQEEVESFIRIIVDNLPASSDRMEAFRKAQYELPECSRVKEYCLSCWPVKEKRKTLFPTEKSAAYSQRQPTSYGNQIVIPTSLRQEKLEKVHAGHQGRERCQSRISCSVWWPRVMKQIYSSNDSAMPYLYQRSNSEERTLDAFLFA